MPEGIFSKESILIAATLLALAVPIKIALVLVQRRISFKEEWRDSISVAISLVPTLIFGLVLAEILREKTGISDKLYVALIMYSLLTTIISQIIIKLMPTKSEYRIFLNES